MREEKLVQQGIFEIQKTLSVLRNWISFPINCCCFDQITNEIEYLMKYEEEKLSIVNAP